MHGHAAGPMVRRVPVKNRDPVNGGKVAIFNKSVPRRFWHFSMQSDLRLGGSLSQPQVVPYWTGKGTPMAVLVVCS